MIRPALKKKKKKITKGPSNDIQDANGRNRDTKFLSVQKDMESAQTEILGMERRKRKGRGSKAETEGYGEKKMRQLPKEWDFGSGIWGWGRMFQ